MGKRKKFKCKSEAQKKAIRTSYAKKSKNVKVFPFIASVPVKLKRHRDVQGNHNHVILEDFEDKHVSVGLTTQPKKGKNSNSPNYILEVSPLGDGKQSYMRRQGTVDFQKNYFDEQSGYMTFKDYEQAKVYGERAKQKYIEKQKK